MESKFDPVAITANGKHYICENISAGTIRVYEIKRRGPIVLAFIDDWCHPEGFASYDEYHAYCTNAVKDNPTPAY